MDSIECKPVKVQDWTKSVAYSPDKRQQRIAELEMAVGAIWCELHQVTGSPVIEMAARGWDAPGIWVAAKYVCIMMADNVGQRKANSLISRAWHVRKEHRRWSDLGGLR